MTTENYARNVITKDLVFFGKVPPAVVLERPSEWATWFPTSAELTRRIGEPNDDYCARNDHRPRRCQHCTAPMRRDVGM